MGQGGGCGAGGEAEGRFQTGLGEKKGWGSWGREEALRGLGAGRHRGGCFRVAGRTGWGDHGLGEARGLEAPGAAPRAVRRPLRGLGRGHGVDVSG